MHVPDATDTMSKAVASMSNVDSNRTCTDADRLLGLIEEDVASLATETVFEWQVPLENVVFDHIAPCTRARRVAESVSSEGSLAFSASTAPTKSTRSFMPTTTASTNRSSLGLTPSSAPSPKCAGTQTYHAQVQCQSTQTNSIIRSRLPLLPDSDGELQRPHVTLNTKRRMSSKFRLTPDSTVDQMVCDAVVKLNRCGKGCCLWHIGLMSLNRRITSMIGQRCRREIVSFVVGQQWQCEECKVIHKVVHDDESDQSSEDESQVFCEFCGFERTAKPMFQPDSSSESGPTVDA